MKTAFDPRHQRRRDAVKDLYAAGFNQSTQNTLALTVLENKDLLDAQIAKCAPQWPIDKLNRIDLAILRLAVFELTVDKREPIKVIIDEAIELAKEFGSESSPSFINGVLGAIVNLTHEATDNQNSVPDPADPLLTPGS